MNRWPSISLVVAIAILGPFVKEQAIAFEKQGNYAQAAEAWRAVTQRDPQDAAAFAQLGIALSKLQKFQEAASAYRKAIALDPKLPGMSLNLGLAEFKQSNFRPAAAAFKSALTADPANAQAQTLLAMSY
jgi:Flp pilus assembly protein TadD